MGRSAARFQHSAVHEHRLRLIGDHVCRRAALDRAKACARRRHRQRHCEDALFAEGGRKAGVWCEAEAWDLLLRFVARDVRPGTVLLLAGEDQSHALVQHKLAVENVLHGVHHRHRRAFVVDDTAAEELAILDLAAVRIVGPARSRRHHIEMHEDAHQFLACANLNVAIVALVVQLCTKPQPLAEGQRRLQRLVHIGAIGLPRLRRSACHTRDRDELSDRFYHFKVPPFCHSISLNR